MSTENEKYKSIKTIRSIWSGIIRRCYNENDKAFPNYGGRGIKVCDRWLIFENYYDDFGKFRPSVKYSTERIDNNKGYSPDNCKWATIREQNRNMRINIIVEYNGKKQLLIDWSRELQIGMTTLCNRLKRGWTIEETFKTPIGKNIKSYDKYHKINFHGQVKSISEWSKETGLSIPTIKARLFKKKSPIEILLKEQRIYKKYIYKNKEYTLTELSKISNIDIGNIHRRINKFNWEVEKAISTPIRFKEK